MAADGRREFRSLRPRCGRRGCRRDAQQSADSRIIRDPESAPRKPAQRHGADGDSGARQFRRVKTGHRQFYRDGRPRDAGGARGVRSGGGQWLRHRHYGERNQCRADQAGRRVRHRHRPADDPLRWRKRDHLGRCRSGAQRLPPGASQCHGGGPAPERPRNQPSC